MKNKGIKISILLIIIGLQSCVIRINDDGSREVTSHERISKFELKDLGKTKKYESEGTIQFQVIKGEDIKKARTGNKKTWVYVWGSWCKPCIDKIPKLIEIGNKNKDLNILLVSEDYKIETLQKILFKNNYDKIPYILDSETYGTNTREKAKKLNQELCEGCEFEAGFPQNYLFNEKENVEFYKSGKLENTELNKAGIKTE